MLIVYPSGLTAETYIIPEGVEVIDAYGFSRSQLKEVTLPVSLLTIGEYAFEYNDILKKVNVPEGALLETIEERAFFNANLNYFVVPNSVTTIGERAFSFYSSSGRTYINATGPKEGFASNWNYNTKGVHYKPNWDYDEDDIPYYKTVDLTGVLPAEISLVNTNLNPAAIIAGTDVEFHVDVPEGKEIKELLVNGVDIKEDVNASYNFTITIPVTGLTMSVTIGDITYTLTYNVNDGIFVFEQEYLVNEQITDEFILEETNISNWNYNGAPFTFGNLYNYGEDITLTATIDVIPKSDITRGISGVSGKAYIKSINNPLGGKLVIIPDTLGGYIVDSTGALSKSVFENTGIVRYCHLPSTFTDLGRSTFINETNLRGVNLPNGLAQIDIFAFSATTNLKSITIPNTVTKIDARAFYYSGLEEINFEDNSGLLTIGEGAFTCTKIKTFKLANDVDIVGMDIFHGCTQLEEITLEATSTRYILDEHGVLYLADGTTLVYYPAAKTLTTYDIQAGTQKIDDYAFYMSSNLTKVNMPSSLTEIGASAFSYTSIQYLVIPLSVATIKASAFLVASSLAMTIYVEATSAQAGWAENWDYGIAAVYYSPNWAYDAFGVPYPL